MADLFKSLGGKPDKLKELLDGINRGAQVEIAQPTEQPQGMEAIAPRQMAQVPATPEVERNLDMFRSLAPQPAAPTTAPAPQNEQMMASLPNSLDRPEMAPIRSAISRDDAIKNARSSSEVMDVAQNLDEYEKPKRNFVDRLFRGIARGYKNWDGQGGLIGLAVNTLGNGVASAASEKVLDNLGRPELEQKLFRKFNNAKNQEDAANQSVGRMGQVQWTPEILLNTGMISPQQYEQQLKGQLLKAQTANTQNQIDARNDTTRSLINDRDRDNDREDEKVRQAEGKKTAVKYNGKWYNRLPNGTETPMYGEDGKQRTELKDVPIATTLSDGTPIFTTGDKAMDREITQNLNQARMDFEAKKLNQADLDKFEQETVDWASKEAKRKQKVSKMILDGQALQNQAAQYEQQAQGLSVIDADQKTELLAKAAKAREDGNSLVKQGNELWNIPTPTPKKPAANLEAPKLGNGKYSGMVFPASSLESMKPNFPGKSTADIKALIENNGGTFR